MAVEVKIDHIRTLSLQERNGSIQRLVRMARVTGLTNTTYNILMSVLENAGIPLAGSQLTTTDDLNLVLVERNPTIVDKGIVDCELVYEFLLQEGQDFDDPPAGVFVGRIEASINQVRSNLDEDGAVIEVSHTYPSDDPDFPSETRTQGGEIDYFQPQKTLRLQGIKLSPYPWLIADAIVGKVNELAWSGSAAQTWLCTACSWQIHDIGDVGAPTNRYRFDFEFQQNLDTWNPTVVFIDERTGKPPPDLVDGTGYKTIRKHGEVNFEQIIGARLQGG